ncbi:MAG: GNAT family N-acetyltransferase [Candidatus Nomurabacteria bacterium]|nr:MAG: GNAT family N-acetyltransferase [Candidatus Nomurabacteria bacterium]HRV75773.1 GNAT family N-acetyltransferase [Candidatus Saccharimonadales bacterium]
MEDNRFEVREVTQDDIDELRPVFNECIRDRETGEVIEDEVDEDLKLIERVARGEETDKRYYVASIGGRVVGGMGFKTKLDEAVRSYAKTDNPMEVVMAYVSTQARGSGAGRALLRRIEEDARKMGFLELLVNSGPRYVESGWGFYDRTIGGKLGFLANYYGEGANAALWREDL